MALLEEFLSLTVLTNKYIPVTPSIKQAQMLVAQEDELLYGGAAGGGKSAGILACALQYAFMPDYHAILLRRSFADLMQPKALIPLSMQWLYKTDAKWKGQEHRWYFPSGATLTFGYMDTEKDKYQYQGPAFNFVGFDELTQFSETMYSYMFSRLRRGAEMKIPCRMRATANPGGEGHDWVNARFRPTQFPGRGRTTTDPETGAKMTCIFIPSKLEDNPHIDHAAYRLSLAQLDPVTRSQLEHGDWDIKPEGNMFKREWFTRTTRPTEQLELMVRAWDLAATPPTAKNPDPDWAVGVKMGRGKSGKYYVMDVVRTRGTPQTIYNLVCDTAEYDGVETTVHIEQEPGSAGKMVVDDFIRKLAGYAVYATKPTGDKITRSRPLSAACSRGDVILVDGLWNKAYLDVMCPFPDGSHDDDVDATAHAFESLHEMYRPITNWGAATIG